VYHLVYDFPGKRVVARSVEGFDAGSTFVRHFDTKWEYEVTSGEFATCRRAYITEDLPEPELPATLRMVDGASVWAGRPAKLWQTGDDTSRVSVWQDAQTGLPVAVMDEGHDGSSLVPLMTHRLDNVVLGAPAAASLALPPPYAHAECEKYPGGWPWIHFFDSYLAA